MAKAPAPVVDALASQPDALQNEWLSELKKRGTGADHRISESELGQQGRELLQLLGSAVATGTDIQSDAWRGVREFLERLSRSRAQQGFTSGETATFVFSLKRPLFERVRAAGEGRRQRWRRDVGDHRADRRARPATPSRPSRRAART